MELNLGDDSSDKDNKMKGSFESVSSEEKNSDKKDKKPSPKKNLSLQQILSGESKEPEKPKTEVKEKEFSFLDMFKDKEAKPETPKDEKVDGIKDKTEIEASGEEEAGNLEEISPTEKTEVAKVYVESAIEDTSLELGSTEPESVEHVEASASLQFLESIQEKINSGEEVDEKAIEEIADEVIEENEVIEELESDDLDLDNEPEDPEEDLSGTPPVSTSGGGVNLPPPVIPASVGSTGGGAGSSGGGGPSSSSGFGGSSGGGGGFGPASVQSPNVPGGQNINQINVTNVEYIDNRRRSNNLLLGGIIGYMIGRRRGRIKTEKELLPIQQKLEKQVVGLQNQLYQQEIKVRKAAAANFELRRPIVIEATPPAKEQQMVKKIPENQEQIITETKEANVDSIKQKTVEQIENTEKSAAQFEKSITPKTVEMMSLPILLSLAESIKIENKTLNSFYEQGELSQNDLRSLIKRYLQGESLNKLLPEYLDTKNQFKPASQEIINDEKQENTVRDNRVDYEDEPKQDAAMQNEDPPKIPNNNEHNFTEADSNLTDEKTINEEQKTKNDILYPVIVAAIVGAVIIIILFT